MLHRATRLQANEVKTSNKIKNEIIQLYTTDAVSIKYLASNVTLPLLRTFIMQHSLIYTAVNKQRIADKMNNDNLKKKCHHTTHTHTNSDDRHNPIQHFTINDECGSYNTIHCSVSVTVVKIKISRKRVRLPSWAPREDSLL